MEAMPSGSRDRIMFAHHWWQEGGAESVLLNWMLAAKMIPGSVVIDVAMNGHAEGATLRDSFAQVADVQYVMDEGNPGREPEDFLGGLILTELPRLLVIMSSREAYCSAASLKDLHPELLVADLIHAEDPVEPGWFSFADDYRGSIDFRIVISETWKKVLMEEFGESQDRIIVGRNAIDTDFYAKKRHGSAGARERIGLPEGKTIVGWFGRYHREKDPELFLEVAETCREDKDLFFVMAGDGPLQAILVAKTQGMENLLALPGFQSLERVYPAIDVMLSTSRYEGYPLASLEAMAMGVPVIAPRLSGYEEQIGLGRCGILYALGSRERKVGAIVDILRAHGRREWEYLGERGSGFVKEYHDLGTLLPEYAGYLRAMMDGKRIPKPAKTLPIAHTFDLNHPAREVVSEYRSQIHALWKELRGKEVMNGSLVEELRQAHERIGLLSQELSGASERSALLSRRFAALHAEYESIAATLREIMGSLSWRLLRRLHSILDIFIPRR